MPGCPGCPGVPRVSWTRAVDFLRFNNVVRLLRCATSWSLEAKLRHQCATHGYRREISTCLEDRGIRRAWLGERCIWRQSSMPVAFPARIRAFPSSPIPHSLFNPRKVLCPRNFTKQRLRVRVWDADNGMVTFLGVDVGISPSSFRVGPHMILRSAVVGSFAIVMLKPL